MQDDDIDQMGFDFPGDFVGRGLVRIYWYFRRLSGRREVSVLRLHHHLCGAADSRTDNFQKLARACIRFAWLP
jgi:hypothetical protein